MGLFLEYGMSIFSVLFWLKLSTLGLTIVFIRSYKNKEFYYYQNLGLSRTFLWASTLSFDFSLYIFLLSGIHIISAPHMISSPYVTYAPHVINGIHMASSPYVTYAPNTVSAVHKLQP